MNADTDWTAATLDIRETEKHSDNSMTHGTAVITQQDDLDHDAAAAKLDEENRNRDPLKYCVLVTTHPKKAFG